MKSFGFYQEFFRDRSSDNFVFECCKEDFYDRAKMVRENSESELGLRACVVSLGEKDCLALEKIHEQCANEFQCKVLSRTFLSAKIFLELQKTFGADSLARASKEELRNGLYAFESGDFEEVKKFYVEAPMFNELSRIYRKNGGFELDFFEDCRLNKYLQESINDLLYSREPFSVKVFSKDRLTTYVTSNGDFVQSPHDYLTLGLGDFSWLNRENEEME